MRRNRFFLLGILAFALIFGMVLVSCGGGDPKALAKQTYELGQQALGAVFDPKKAVELAKKTAAIQKKVAQLSDSDKAIYNEELARLAGQGLGGVLKAAGEVLDSVNVEDAQKALDTAKDAVDTAQKATNALKAFGF